MVSRPIQYTCTFYLFYTLYAKGRNSNCLPLEVGVHRACDRVLGGLENQDVGKKRDMQRRLSSPARAILLALVSGALLLLTVLRKGVPVVVAESNSDPERLNVDSSMLRNLLWYSGTDTDRFGNTSGYSQFGDDADSDADVSEVC